MEKVRRKPRVERGGSLKREPSVAPQTKPMSAFKRNQFRLGGLEWRLEFTSDLKGRAKNETNFGNRTSGLIGLAVYADQLILISDKLSPRETDQTIFHEMIHAAMPDLNERRVTTLEQRLFPVLRRFGLRFTVKT